MKNPLIVYLLLINAAGFLLMLTDKRRAIKKQWRIPELYLLLSAALGGSVGALVGMHLFHHKTRHLKFVLGIPAILLAQLSAMVWMLVCFTH